MNTKFCTNYKSIQRQNFNTKCTVATENTHPKT